MRAEAAVSGHYIKQEIVLRELPPLYWFYVLVRGDEVRTTALSNPFFAGVP